MKIEILQSCDLPSYKALIDECFGGEGDIEKYKSYSENAVYKIYVVKDKGAVVGSATVYPIELFTFDFQPCLMLFNVAVKASHREQKIAKELLLYIMEEAKKEGYRSISLTCLDTAYPAHKLYESVGFKRTSSLKYNVNL
jgi:predicted N-acetyltransferase YhbS